MQVRPIQFTSDPTGAPAVEYEYHIGKTFEDPTIDENKLTVKDGFNGSDTSNPYFVNSVGLFQNKAGQQINPWIDETAYAITVLSPSGGVRYSNLNFTSDSISAVGQSNTVVDQVFNNFAVTLTSDLSPYETIYVESFLAGWENTISGPEDGFYAHANGTTGTPSSGVPSLFFDSNGDGWGEDDAQRMGDGDVTLAKLAANSVDASKIVSGGVGNSELANEVVTTIKIADLNVTLAKLAANSVDSSKIATGAVGASELAANSVTNVKIDDGVVTLNKMAALSVGSSQIIANAVGNSELGSGVVTQDKMAGSSVGSSQIITDAVGSSEIASGAVGSSELGTDSVTTIKITDANVTEDKLSSSVQGKLNNGNTPDVYSVRIENTGAATYSFFSNPPAPVGWSVAGTGTGLITLTHNLATLDYSVISQVSGNLGQTKLISETTHNINTSTFEIVDGTDTPIDDDFTVILTA
ncbi:MAG: hypothetical protein V3V84_07650 [Candidatus Bathyarchaeia archaeon]